MTKEPLFHRWWARSALSLVVAILLSIAAFLLGWTSSAERGIAIGFCTWIIGMIFQIVYLLRSFHVDRLENKYFLEVINEDDRLLLELQSKFRQIAARPLSGKPNQVFINYCRRNLKQTLTVATGAASGELEVQDHHFDTVDAVLDAFDGCEERTFRCVWLIGDGDDLFDDSWRKYMKCLIELSRSRQRNKQVQVRILFVVGNDLEDAALLRQRSVALVLGFVSSEQRFECRLMSRSDYDVQLHDAGLAEQCVDFGVYGNHLLFRTTSYEPRNMGRFSVDQAMIDKYRRAHDVAMDAPSVRRLPTDLPKKVSVKQFLGYDTADKAPETAAGRGQE